MEIAKNELLRFRTEGGAKQHLTRGKRLLAQLARTEFILVLDDDFVRSPLSCVECMVLHMRSRLHSLSLPFDLLGFPILEDH